VTRRSALISGSGIAGPVVAYWLAEAGWDVTVVERAERLRASGYPVDVRGAAVDVLDRMGLSEAVTAHRHRHVPTDILTPGGRRLTRVDLGGLVNDEESGDVEVARGALTRLLYGAGADRVEYVFGETVTALSPTADGVDVTFAHRPPQTFDVVIGADGIHSKVRALAFGHEDRFLRHLGACVAIWNMDNEMFPPATGYMYSHAGRTAMVERPADGGETRAYLTFVHPEPGTLNRHDTDEIATELRRAFAQDRWRTAEIIDTLPSARDVFFDTVSQVRMDRWSTERIALVGDAAYAPAFLSGQGTSLAIAGAYVLASELARADQSESAFAAYEQRLRGYVAKNQELSLRTDSVALSRTRGQLLRRNATLVALPWLRRFGVDRARRGERRAAVTDLVLTEKDLRRGATSPRQ
jgi:2-polyprenyl-6-methoxyphenol hydroxylase-like FAD-dependent oxidoreductase